MPPASKQITITLLLFHWLILNCVASRTYYLSVASSNQEYWDGSEGEGVYCNIFNSSGLEQNLSVRVLYAAQDPTSNNTPTVGVYSTTREDTDTYTLQPEDSLNLKYVSATGQAANYPRAIIFTVSETQGHLVGNCVNHYYYNPSTNLVGIGHYPIPINHGKPF